MKAEIIKIAQDLEQGNISELTAQKTLLGLFGVTNCYFVKDSEYKIMKKLKSNTVMLTSGSGIGIGCKCLNEKGEWVDITDYNSW